VGGSDKGIESSFVEVYKVLNCLLTCFFVMLGQLSSVLRAFSWRTCLSLNKVHVEDRGVHRLMLSILCPVTFSENRAVYEIIIFIISIRLLGLFWQEPRAQSGDRYGSGTVHF
jgi:hypothetical protein